MAHLIPPLFFLGVVMRNWINQKNSELEAREHSNVLETRAGRELT